MHISGSPRLPKFWLCREGHKMSSFLVVEQAFFTSFQNHFPQGAQETTRGRHCPGLWSFQAISLLVCSLLPGAPHSLQDIMYRWRWPQHLSTLIATRRRLPGSYSLSLCLCTPTSFCRNASPTFLHGQLLLTPQGRS